MKNIILHLSDLQFGKNHVESTDGNEYLGDYMSEVKSLLDDANFLSKQIGSKPNFIVISGDIAEWSLEKEYKQAEEFFTSICKHFSIDRQNVIFTPGNHDINRKLCEATRLIYETDYKPFNPPYYKKFEKYEQFFNRFYADVHWEREPYKFTADKLHVIYPFQKEGIAFVSLNSCVDESDENHYGNITVGQLRNANEELNKIDQQNCMLRIAVFHHNFIRASKMDDENLRDADELKPYFIDGNYRIILHGHRHLTQQNIIGEGNKTIHILEVGSEGLDGNAIPNNCRRYQIIEINDYNVKAYRRLFDPTDKGGKGSWKADMAQEQTEIYRDFDLGSISSGVSEMTNGTGFASNSLKEEHVQYHDFVKQAIVHAQTYIRHKSQAITMGTLPDFIERKIIVQNDGQKVETVNSKASTEDDLRKISLDSHNNFISLYELVNENKPIFLFGELGSGKSTIVGCLVQKYADSGNTLPLLIPAGYFNNKMFETKVEVENIISQYASEQIFIGTKFNLETALKDGVEIILIIDGFDELNRKKARDLLIMIEDIALARVNIHVIATGRPIELYGLNYDQWKCTEIPQLTQEEQVQLFVNEAIANGLDEKLAKKDANDRFKKLVENPELMSISSTPLALRLLYPYLLSNPVSKTLGDLLYDIISERLGNWDEKSGKVSVFDDFIKAYPNKISREPLLGQIAALIYNSDSKSISSEAIYHLLDTYIKNSANKSAIVSQALDFFKSHLLQKNDDLYSFSLQPLFQISIGMYIANQILNSQSISLQVDHKSLWREYSFAATIVRRKSNFDNVRSIFNNYIKKDLCTSSVSPMVALIVYESKDHNLAEAFINHLKSLEFRPIHILVNMKDMAELAFAHSIKLAGKTGFEWFRNQYLDPRYPNSWDYNITSKIFEYWVLISDYKVGDDELQTLRGIFGTIAEVGALSSFYISKTVALLLPDEFPANIRISLYIKNLSSSLFQLKAREFLINEVEQGNKNLVSEELVKQCNTKDIRDNAVKLWYELNSEIVPPVEIIQASIVISALNEENNILDCLEEQVDRKKINSLLRLYLSFDGEIAPASAIVLNRRGEKSLGLLGDALLRGFHDGGKFVGAEEVLHQIIHSQGARGILWIADRFMLNSFSVSDGAFSGHWRILLSELIDCKENFLDQFSYAINFVGEFNLPRYPEIRYKFQNLLKSKPQYYGHLKKKLNSFNIRLRYNAARILLTCFPESEIDAADIVICAAQQNFECHEWHEFSLKLVLGESVKEHIFNKISQYGIVQRTYALTLLYRNNYFLSKELYKQLIMGLLENNFDTINYNSRKLLTSIPILSEHKAFKILCECLELGGEIGKRASCYLWDYHRVNLTKEQWAKTVLLITTNNLISFPILCNQFENCRNDTMFVENIEHLSVLLQKENLHEPVGYLYMRTFSDPNVWKDLIWVLLVENADSSFRKVDEALWILSKGLKFKEFGEVIGSASLEFLESEYVEGWYKSNTKCALALLAHEFSKIDNEEIKSIILKSRQNGDKELVSALISRLGYVPDGFNKVREKKTANNSQMVTLPNFEYIMEATRDVSGGVSQRIEINNSLILLLQNILVTDSLNDEEILLLEKRGILSLFVATVVRFCQSSLFEYEWCKHLLGIEFWKAKEEGGNVDLVFTRLLYLVKTFASEDNRTKYLDCLNDAVKLGNERNAVAIYRELLNFEDNTNVLMALLESVGKTPYIIDIDLANSFSNYLVTLTEEKKAIVLPIIKRTVSDFCYINSKYFNWKDGLCYLLFSVAAMYLQSSCDKETSFVFLRGIQSMFIYQYDEQNQNQNRQEKIFYAGAFLSTIISLLRKIPKDLISKCIKEGLDSDVAEIAVSCRMLNAIANNQYPS